MNLHKVILYLSNPKNLFLFFLILGAVVFANGLNHPLMIDDHVFFDEMARDPRNLWTNFIPDKTKVLHLEGSPTEVYYRPLMVVQKLMFLVLGSNTFGLHVFNLLLFVTAVWLLALWLGRMSSNILFGVWTGIFVLVHPLNGIIVNFKTGGIFAQQLIFMILAGDWLLRENSSLKRRAAAMLFFLLALLCHETAFVLPLCLLTLNAFVRKESWGQSFYRTAPFWIMAIIYFFLRLRWASLNENIFKKLDGYHMDLAQILASWFSLQAWYLPKFLLPQGIVISVIRPVIRENTWIWIVGGLAVWILIITFLFRFLRTQGWVWTGLSWLFFGFLMIGAGALFHGQELMVEPHWMVLTSVGFFMGFSWVLVTIQGRWRKPTVIASLVLSLIWITSTWVYNSLWNSEREYTRYWLAQSPDFKPLNMYIARSYFAEGNFDLAAKYYKLALTNQYPDYLMYCNLGSIALLQGKLEEAKVYLEKALQIEPKARSAMNALGVVYVKWGNLIRAEEYFKRSVAVNPFDTTAQRNLSYFKRMKASTKDLSSGRVILEH